MKIVANFPHEKVYLPQDTWKQVSLIRKKDLIIDVGAKILNKCNEIGSTFSCITVISLRADKLCKSCDSNYFAYNGLTP